MKAMAKRLIAAVLFATVAACSGGGKAPAPCESGAAANEYAVYSAAVEEFSKGHHGKSVVIYDRTIDASDPAGVTSEWMLRCGAFVPEADKAMLDSYKERNREPLVLARNFTLGREYVLASAADLIEIPNDRIRSEGVGAKYPDAFGLVWLSRVGFNAGMSRAVVYISRGACGLGCGEGACMVLVREDCQWKVKDKGRVWMS
jgi:hypothetical protein